MCQALLYKGIKVEINRPGPFSRKHFGVGGVQTDNKHINVHCQVEVSAKEK